MGLLHYLKFILYIYLDTYPDSTVPTDKKCLICHTECKNCIGAASN